MTANLQSLYRDIINSNLEENLKFTLTTLIETSVPENEEAVKSKISLIIENYVTSLKVRIKNLQEKSDLLKITEDAQSSESQNNTVSNSEPLNQISDNSTIQQIQNQLDKLSSQ